jgi:hypothetical protein
MQKFRSIAGLVVLGLSVAGCASNYQLASYTPPSNAAAYYPEPDETAPAAVRKSRPASSRQASNKSRVVAHTAAATDASAVDSPASWQTQRITPPLDGTTGSSVATEPNGTPTVGVIEKGRAKQLKAERDSDDEFQRQMDHDRRVSSGVCRC